MTSQGQHQSLTSAREVDSSNGHNWDPEVNNNEGVLITNVKKKKFDILALYSDDDYESEEDSSEKSKSLSSEDERENEENMGKEGLAGGKEKEMAIGNEEEKAGQQEKEKKESNGYKLNPEEEEQLRHLFKTKGASLNDNIINIGSNILNRKLKLDPKCEIIEGKLRGVEGQEEANVIEGQNQVNENVGQGEVTEIGEEKTDQYVDTEHSQTPKSKKHSKTLKHRTSKAIFKSTESKRKLNLPPLLTTPGKNTLKHKLSVSRQKSVVKATTTPNLSNETRPTEIRDIPQPAPLPVIRKSELSTPSGKEGENNVVKEKKVNEISDKDADIKDIESQIKQSAMRANIKDKIAHQREQQGEGGADVIQSITADLDHITAKRHPTKFLARRQSVTVSLHRGFNKDRDSETEPDNRFVAIKMKKSKLKLKDGDTVKSIFKQSVKLALQQEKNKSMELVKNDENDENDDEDVSDEDEDEDDTEDDTAHERHTMQVRRSSHSMQLEAERADRILHSDDYPEPSLNQSLGGVWHKTLTRLQLAMSSIAKGQGQGNQWASENGTKIKEALHDITMEMEGKGLEIR